MKYHDDFQLEERIVLNIQRKRRRLRWGLFGINLAGFLLYSGFVFISATEIFGYSYFISSYRDLFRFSSHQAHILLIPLLFWGIALLIHFLSIQLELGRFDRLIAGRAQHEEDAILEALLQRLAQAEKRKRDTSHLEDHEAAHDDSLLLHRIDEEQTAQGS